MKKRMCALLLCLAALFSLAGCGTKPKTPVKGQNEPNPVRAQGLPEAEPGCVPLLLSYTCGEPGSQVFQYYSATWNIQRNTLTQGQLFYTGTSYGFVPDGWRQERATFDGQSFTYIRDGQERREPLPETTEDRGSLRCAAADGDTAVVVYMSCAGDDALLTVSVGRYPLGHPEQAAWVQAQISDSAECYVSTIFTGTTLYAGGQVCLAAGESILLMDPASGEVRQLDLSPMSAPLPDGVSRTEESYLGASVIGSYGDVLLVGKALYQEGVWDRYHYVMAAYQDGKLMAMLDQNSADSAQLTLYGPDGKIAGSCPLMTEDYVASGGTALPVEYIGQLFPLQ